MRGYFTRRPSVSHLQSVATTVDGGQTWTCSFCSAVVGVSHTCEGLSAWIAERLLPPAVEDALDAHAEVMAATAAESRETINAPAARASREE